MSIRTPGIVGLGAVRFPPRAIDELVTVATNAGRWMALRAATPGSDQLAETSTPDRIREQLSDAARQLKQLRSVTTDPQVGFRIDTTSTILQHMARQSLLLPHFLEHLEDLDLRLSAGNEESLPALLAACVHAVDLSQGGDPVPLLEATANVDEAVASLHPGQLFLGERPSLQPGFEEVLTDPLATVLRAVDKTFRLERPPHDIFEVNFDVFEPEGGGAKTLEALIAGVYENLRSGSTDSRLVKVWFGDTPREVALEILKGILEDPRNQLRWREAAQKLTPQGEFAELIHLVATSAHLAQWADARAHEGELLRAMEVHDALVEDIGHLRQLVAGSTADPAKSPASLLLGSLAFQKVGQALAHSSSPLTVLSTFALQGEQARRWSSLQIQAEAAHGVLRNETSALAWLAGLHEEVPPNAYTEATLSELLSGLADSLSESPTDLTLVFSRHDVSSEQVVLVSGRMRTAAHEPLNGVALRDLAEALGDDNRAPVAQLVRTLSVVLDSGVIKETHQSRARRPSGAKSAQTLQARTVI